MQRGKVLERSNSHDACMHAAHYVCMHAAHYVCMHAAHYVCMHAAHDVCMHGSVSRLAGDTLMPEGLEG